MDYNTAPQAAEIVKILDEMPAAAHIALAKWLNERAVALAYLALEPPNLVFADSDRIPAAVPPPPSGPPATPATPELPEGVPPEVLEHPELFAWLDGHLKKHYRGEPFTVTGLHDEATAADVELRCPPTREGRLPCRGNFTNCGLRRAIDTLVAAQDYPLKVVKKRGGPYGHRWEYTGGGV